MPNAIHYPMYPDTYNPHSISQTQTACKRWARPQYVGITPATVSCKQCRRIAIHHNQQRAQKLPDRQSPPKSGDSPSPD